MRGGGREGGREGEREGRREGGREGGRTGGDGRERRREGVCNDIHTDREMDIMTNKKTFVTCSA